MSSSDESSLPDHPGTPPAHPARRWARPRLWAWLSLVLAATLAIGAIGANGGLAAVEPPAPTPTTRTVPSGEPFDIGPATIKVRNGVAVSELAGILIDTEKVHLLAVVVVITVTDDKTWGAAFDALLLNGVDGVEKPQAYRILLLRDAQSANGIQPGLPEEVAYLWQQSNDAAVPDSVTITFQCQERFEYEQSAGHLYAQAEPCAETTVDLEDRTVKVTPTP